jgi:hypothetical protein
MFLHRLPLPRPELWKERPKFSIILMVLKYSQIVHLGPLLYFSTCMNNLFSTILQHVQVLIVLRNKQLPFLGSLFNSNVVLFPLRFILILL